MPNTPKNILFIEDEQAVSELYAMVLKSHGFAVTCVFDGQQGLARAQSEPYDLILLDLMLPEKSGLEVLKTLRDPALSPTFNQQTPIYLFTNFEEDDVTKEELRNLAQAYIVKVNMTPKSLATMLETGNLTPAGEA